MEALTLHRTTDPDTSVEAAEAILSSIHRTQKQVLDLLKRHPRGLTDHEIQLMLGGRPTSKYRSRRAELTRKGQVKDSGERRLINGRNCIIWCAVQP
jgi:hypothetical protein